MFGFPASTEFNKRIPKQKFYEHMKFSHSHRRVWIEQVRCIYWRNKLATTTLNLAEGHTVSEIEVFEIQLNTPEFDETLLRQIDLEIPYHILFILSYEELAQAWIGYKEIFSTRKKTSQIDRYFHTAWIPKSNLQFTLTGLNMDAIYEALVRHIAGTTLSSKNGESLKASLSREAIANSLTQEIKSLENKIRKERQLNRRFEINKKLKLAKTKLKQFS